MGEVIQLQGDHRTKVMDFLTDKDKDKMGKYALAKENIKVEHITRCQLFYRASANICLYRSTDFNPRVSGLFLSETYIGLSGRRLSEEMRIDRWVVFERYRVFGIGKSSKPKLLEQAFFHGPPCVAYRGT